MGQKNGSNQVLTFTLGMETYGVDILQVQEIRSWSPVTRVPQSPPHVLGVLNLHGSIVPIVDLRMRFRLEQMDYTAITVIIIMSVETANGRRDLGVVINGVSNIIDLKAEDLKAAPDLGGQVSTEFIHKLMTMNNNIIILLDIDRLIGADMGQDVDQGVGESLALPKAANG